MLCVEVPQHKVFSVAAKHKVNCEKVGVHEGHAVEVPKLVVVCCL